MPELPEVETVVQDLRASIVPKSTITDVQVRWANTINNDTEFVRQLTGRTIVSIDRRAKWMRFWLETDAILYGHLRMSGRMQIRSASDPIEKHEHLVFELNNRHHLRFYDPRKFGRWHIQASIDNPIEAKLGPEPLGDDFTQKLLIDKLKSSSRMIKPLLLDQSFVAGLGNIYVDESLWMARIHPITRADQIPVAKARALYTAIQTALHTGLRNMGTSLGTGKANFYSVAGRKGRNRDQLNVFRRTGQPCPRCETSIERIVVGQRSTHICPHCQ